MDGRLKFFETPLVGAYIIKPKQGKDNRGIFTRIFCKKEFKKINHHKEFVQVNHSINNKKGCLRGMHYQLPPKTEIKLIKCVNGAIYDVIIDIRKDSPTFLKWFATTLSKDNMKMIYIPEGFAHGFQTLENNSELIYFHTEYYSPENEDAINYNDPLVNINWPLKITDISEKDKNHPFLDKDFEGIKI